MAAIGADAVASLVREAADVFLFVVGPWDAAAVTAAVDAAGGRAACVTVGVRALVFATVEVALARRGRRVGRPEVASMVPDIHRAQLTPFAETADVRTTA